MAWQERYERWHNFKALDKDLSVALEQIKHDPEKLEDAFYTNLSFGTAGMRGIIGPGTNRMNIYTVRRAAEGLARHIETYTDLEKVRGVVIAYDSRHQSKEFAMEAAKTLGAHDIQVYVFESLRTTPELSFAVRYLNAFRGIVITASHNPAPYNGFKVYGADGAQSAFEEADKIVEAVNGVEDELTISVADQAELLTSGRLQMIGEKLDQAYLKQIESISIQPDHLPAIAKNLKIVYTPLHGTGNRPVRNALHNLGFNDLIIVEEQAQPDPNFSTVTQPNPEEKQAFEMAIDYGKRVDADLLLATDPDTDRVGVAVKTGHKEYALLNGNQIGALLVDYLITEKQARHELSDKAVVLKSIVTSEFGRKIANEFGVTTIDTLTGFKYIAEKIESYNQTKAFDFLMGYEESYGYLIGDFVRDKDAIQTCTLIAEAAAHYKSKGSNLNERLEILYETYGYFKEDLIALTFEGKAGVEKISQLMHGFRDNPLHEIGGQKIIAIEDYDKGIKYNLMSDSQTDITLPKANVLKYYLENDAWFCIRPSGTEPKIKFYMGVSEASDQESSNLLETLKTAIQAKL